MSNQKKIHIGNEIRRVVHARGISLKQFAAELCCERNSLYYLFSQPSIDIERLLHISQVLQFDFLSLYGAERPCADGGQQFIGVVVLPESACSDFVSRYPAAHIIRPSYVSENSTDVSDN